MKKLKTRDEISDTQSLKRYSSNTNFLQNFSSSQKSKVTKIPKQNNSFKSTPLTIKRQKIISSNPEGKVECWERDVQDKKNSNPKSSSSSNIRSHYSPTNTTKCSTSLSEHSLRLECKNTKFSKNKIMTKKTTGNSFNPPVATRKAKGDNVPKLTHEKLTTEFQSPSLRNDYSLSNKDLPNILKDTKRNIKNNKQQPKKVYTSWSSKSKIPNITSLVDQQEEEEDECEVKLLKSCLSTTCKSTENLKKKVRFNLESENEIPKSLKYLYTPLNDTSGREEKSEMLKDNSDIPEKEVPTQNLKKQNRFSVIPTDIVYYKKNNPSINNADGDFLHAVKEEKMPVNINCQAYNTSCTNNLIEETMIPEPGPKEVKNISGNDVTNSRKKYDKNKKKCPWNDPCFNNYDQNSVAANSASNYFPKCSQSQVSFKSTPKQRNCSFMNIDLESTIKSPSNSQLQDTQSKKVHSINCKTISTNTPRSYKNNLHNENINSENLYNLLVDKLLRSPKTEISNFLDILSLIISSKENNSSTLKKILNDIDCNSTQTQHDSISENMEKHDNNLNKRNYECRHTAYDPDSEEFTSSGSSVTSVSSLPSDPSKEWISHQVNIKSFQFLHQCLEETFCYDNVSGSEKSHTRTEYRNYSHSCSTDSRKSNKIMLNHTLQRLTTLLEELNTKVDKIAINDGSEYCKSDELPTKHHLEQCLQGKLNENKARRSKSKSEYLKQPVTYTIGNELNPKTKEQENHHKTSFSDPNFSGFGLTQKEGKYIRKERTRSPSIENLIQSDVRENMMICPENQFTRVTGRSEKAGIIFYSQSGSEAFIKFIDKHNSNSRRILPCYSEPSDTISRNKTVIFQHNSLSRDTAKGTNSILQIAPKQDPIPISNNDVQCILKHITEGINRVKLTSPCMYEPVTKRHKIDGKKSDISIKNISKAVQKRIHSFMSSIFKFVPIRENSKFKKPKFKQAKIEKMDGTDEATTSSILRILFPFCSPGVDSEDDIKNEMTRNDERKEEIDNEMQTEYEETEGNGSDFPAWPDIKRTKYPNGKLHFGSLERMPEPKIIPPRMNMTSSKLHQSVAHGEENLLIEDNLLTFSDSCLQRRRKKSLEEISTKSIFYK